MHIDQIHAQDRMGKMITFFVDGIPGPGGSKKAFQHKTTGKMIVVDMGGAKTKAWRQAVVDAAYTEMQFSPCPDFEAPLAVTCRFHCRRPKSHFNKHGLKKDAPRFPTTRPDATKLFRSTEDSLTGILWKDDSQIVQQHISKIYSETPGAEITVEELME